MPRLPGASRSRIGPSARMIRRKWKRETTKGSRSSESSANIDGYAGAAIGCLVVAPMALLGLAMIIFAFHISMLIGFFALIFVPVFITSVLSGPFSRLNS